jgi:hypothetical protein
MQRHHIPHLRQHRNDDGFHRWNREAGFRSHRRRLRSRPGHLRCRRRGRDKDHRAWERNRRRHLCRQSIANRRQHPHHGPAPISFDLGNTFRNGILKLDSVFGSELLDIRVSVSPKYWNTNNWDTDLADSCTSPSASAIALGNCIAPPASTAVSAANVAIVPADHRPTGAVALVGGVGTIVLANPSPLATGSSDVVLTLGSGLVSPNSYEPNAAAFVGGTATSWQFAR